MCCLRKAEQNGELSGIDEVNMSKKLFGHKRCHKTYTKRRKTSLKSNRLLVIRNNMEVTICKDVNLEVQALV